MSILYNGQDRFLTYGHNIVGCMEYEGMRILANSVHVIESCFSSMRILSQPDRQGATAIEAVAIAAGPCQSM